METTQKNTETLKSIIDTTERTKNYETVAKVVAESMDDAWKQIITKLAQGDTTYLTSKNEIKLDKRMLGDFINTLNTAYLHIEFSPSVVKGPGGFYNAHCVNISNTNETSLKGEVNVSIGVGVKW
jgi:hypothetical protein